MIGLLFSLGHLGCLLLFGLEPLHDFFGFLVLVDHDVAHAQIGYDDSGETKHVICIFIDDGLIIPDGLVISLEHEEDVCDVEFPSLVVCAEFSALPEQFLNN